MNFFRRGFWPKFWIGILLLLQFAAIIALIIFLIQITHNSVWMVVLVFTMFLINVFFEVLILGSNIPNAFKVSWMWVVACLPIFGVLLYLIFANKQTSWSSQKKMYAYAKPIAKCESNVLVKKRLANQLPNYEPLSTYLDKIGGAAVHANTTVEYFSVGDQVLTPLLNDLKKAKHYIFIEFFIIEQGEFFNPILKILEEKVRAGLDVRIIYDDVGSLGTLPVNFAKKLEKKGIKVLRFNKFRPLLDVRQNNRDHRKMIVIDGYIAYSGGWNLADEYINKKEKFGHWKDSGIRIYGEATYNFTLMFLSIWKLYKDHQAIVDKSMYQPSVYISEDHGFPMNDGYVQPYGDLPFDKEAFGERVYLDIIHRARKYVYIMTPYLIIDEETQNALIEAVKMGIDVRLVTPAIPDKKAVYNVTRSHYGNLLEAGVRIYEYTPGFIHGKTFLADDTIATVGTFNLDYRSLYLHLENGTLLFQNRCLVNIKKDFAETFKQSHEVNLEEWMKWKKRNSSYWKILKIISPFL